MSKELDTTDAAVKQVTNFKPHLFRPPYGVTNPNVKKAIIKGNYIPVGWSVRSFDTVIKDERKLLQRITRSVKPVRHFLIS